MGGPAGARVGAARGVTHIPKRSSYRPVHRALDTPPSLFGAMLSSWRRLALSTRISVNTLIAFSDGRESDYSYSLSLQGRETRFEITGSVPTHGPGGVVLDPGAHAP